MGKLAGYRAGVVHQNVDATVRRQGLLDQPAHLSFLGDVARDSPPAYLVGNRIDLLPAARRAHHLRALCSKRDGDGLADAAPRAGYYCHLISQLHSGILRRPPHASKSASS